MYPISHFFSSISAPPPNEMDSELVLFPQTTAQLDMSRRLHMSLFFRSSRNVRLSPYFPIAVALS